MDQALWRALKQWNFWDRKPPKSIPRQATQDALKFIGRPEAHYLVGPRRAGKTYVCYQLIDALTKKHGSTSCLYVNFEEPAFSANLNTEFITQTIQHFKNEHDQNPRFVFLDEVQHVPKWERWVRSAVDRKEHKVVATGSSAQLLNSEFSTALGGRGISTLVLPFSFPEYEKARPHASLEDYLQTGGYPAAVLEENAERRQRVLEEYFETAIARDVIARHALRDPATLRTLATYALTNSGKPFSYNQLRALTGLSFDAIKHYLACLQDAYVIFAVPAFSYSLKKAMQKPRKYYAYDTGLASAVSKSFSPDFGRKAENAVAIELLRRRKEPQYGSEGKHEVDFIVKDGLHLSAINVCYDEKPPAREQAGLDAFTKTHKTRETLLLAGPKNIQKWLSTT